MHTNSGNKVFYVIVHHPMVWNPYEVSLFQPLSLSPELSVKNDFGVTAKSKNHGCDNRNVTANDKNMVCCNNLS